MRSRRHLQVSPPHSPVDPRVPTARMCSILRSSEALPNGMRPRATDCDCFSAPQVVHHGPSKAFGSTFNRIARRRFGGP